MWSARSASRPGTLRQTLRRSCHPDFDRIKSEGYRPLLGNYINQSDVVRHDSNLLATDIMRLLD